MADYAIGAENINSWNRDACKHGVDFSPCLCVIWHRKSVGLPVGFNGSPVLLAGYGNKPDAAAKGGIVPKFLNPWQFLLAVGAAGVEEYYHSAFAGKALAVENSGVGKLHGKGGEAVSRLQVGPFFIVFYAADGKKAAHQPQKQSIQRH